MQTIIILCEGRTEMEFCRLLQKYLDYAHCRIEVRDLGGNCYWQKIKEMVEISLKTQPKAFVTTMVDYYGVRGTTFPQWQGSLKIADKRKRIHFLEEAMKNDIDPTFQSRFIPYFQLHEFEALLFNNIKVFDDIFEENEYNKKELERVFEEFPDPEMINDQKETSPSHRLEKIIKGYSKPVYGCFIAEYIGIENIYNKNLHFSEWIDKLNASLKKELP